MSVQFLSGTSLNASFCLNRLGFTYALQVLTNKLFAPLFLENYSFTFTERKNFSRKALQSDGNKRVSPNLRLENRPAMAGMSRISDKGERREKKKQRSITVGQQMPDKKPGQCGDTSVRDDGIGMQKENVCRTSPH